MIDTKDGVQFDPGFLPHMSAFAPNIEYVYRNLSMYKNFSQKKAQFKMYYPKILGLLKNYTGFYAGCILWAAYISKIDNQPLVNNICYGGEYSEDETLSEVNLIETYLGQLKKDVKYYTGQDFTPDETELKIMAAYKEFLKANKGFTATASTNDIKLPSSFKPLSDEDSKIVADEIEKVIDNGRLYDLTKIIDKVI